MRRHLSLVFLIIFLVFSLVNASEVDAASGPVLSVEPKDTTVAPGETFTVNITIADATLENSVNGIYGWQFVLSFNSSVLNAVSVSEGPFLMEAGSTYWTPPTINNATGIVVATDFLFPYPDFGAFGSGTLANVTFKVMSEGKTSVKFLYEPPPEGRGETKLRTYDPTPPGNIQIVDHTVVDGTFEYPLFRDVAVVAVEASPTDVVAGEIVSINVTVENKGKVAESFDVTVSYDSAPIETKHVTDLALNSSQLLSFSWNTGGVVEGNHTITATASTVSGEADTANNVYHGDVVEVRVQTSVFPMEFLIIAVIIVIVVVAVALFLYMKRRK